MEKSAHYSIKLYQPLHDLSHLTAQHVALNLTSDTFYIVLFQWGGRRASQEIKVKILSNLSERGS